ncbi:MAG TPA: hypothetical protein VMG14_01715 [Thermoplasmata archaeon]|nr:hypothetical protein [Thermoplasmata archaeon]
MAPPIATGGRAASTDRTSRSDYGNEVERENAQVLYPLLDRISEIAGRIEGGERIEAGYLLEAVQIWGRYARELHERRIEALHRLLPETRFIHPVVRTWGTGRLRRRAPSGGDEESADTIEGRYGEIRQDQARMTQRLAVLENLISEYRQNVHYLTGELLASLLRSGAFSDRAWARYEESFVRESLDRPHRESDDRALDDERASAATARAPLEAEVRRFLDRPIPGASASGRP